eukprot:TRINITY_DN1992_c0_g1_i2.p1 TRINITY_DN1992_c0_g1~~TRINITY_DN1992_c0_g1_i2.p1  ORF type:complete len:155 (-),score=21.59 TRINITY_DN1992_c0_g1_i2:36-500(-)
MQELAVKLHTSSLFLLVVDLFLKYLVRKNLLSSPLSSQEANQNDLSIFISLIVCMIDLFVYALFLLPGLPLAFRKEQIVAEERFNNIPKTTLMLIHHLMLVGAFLNLLSIQSCSLISLMSAILIGVSIRTIDSTGDQLFFKLAAGQKREISVDY